MSVFCGFLAGRTAQKELFKNAQKTTPRILADSLSNRLIANRIPPALAMESFCGSESHWNFSCSSNYYRVVQKSVNIIKNFLASLEVSLVIRAIWVVRTVDFMGGQAMLSSSLPIGMASRSAITADIVGLHFKAAISAGFADLIWCCGPVDHTMEIAHAETSTSVAGSGRSCLASLARPS